MGVMKVAIRVHFVHEDRENHMMMREGFLSEGKVNRVNRGR